MLATMVGNGAASCGHRRSGGSGYKFHLQRASTLHLWPGFALHQPRARVDAVCPPPRGDRFRSPVVRRLPFRRFSRGSENNAQATRAESVRAVLIKTVHGAPETAASLRLASLGASRSLINSQYENFGAGLCVRRRHPDRGAPGGGFRL
jgi:hypothetical protein